MKWFGVNWGAPLCDETRHVTTPLGQPCQYCKEPIVSGDNGVMMPTLTHTGSEVLPMHYECHLRNAAGSIGHQAGLCGCRNRSGAPVRLRVYSAANFIEDPDGLTRREAARAAAEMFEAPHNAAIRGAILSRWMALGASREFEED